MHIKKGDNVIILAGKDRGKTGTVVKSIPQKDKVIVSGINMLKIHKRPTQSGQKGQIVEQASPIHVSNVKLSGSKTKKVEAVKPKAKKAAEKKAK